MLNPYAILGLDENATPAQVAKSYREKSAAADVRGKKLMTVALKAIYARTSAKFVETPPTPKSSYDRDYSYRQYEGLEEDISHVETKSAPCKQYHDEDDYGDLPYHNAEHVTLHSGDGNEIQFNHCDLTKSTHVHHLGPQVSGYTGQRLQPSHSRAALLHHAMKEAHKRGHDLTAEPQNEAVHNFLIRRGGYEKDGVVRLEHNFIAGKRKKAEWAESIEEAHSRKDLCIGCEKESTFRSVSPDDEKCESCGIKYPRQDNNAGYIISLFKQMKEQLKESVTEAKKKPQGNPPAIDASPFFCLNCTKPLVNGNAMQPFCDQACYGQFNKQMPENTPIETPGDSPNAINFVTPAVQSQFRDIGPDLGEDFCEWAQEYLSNTSLEEGQKPFSSVEYKLHRELADKIHMIGGQLVPSHELDHRGGRIKVPHISIHAGLMHDDHAAVENALKGESHAKATLGDVDVFEGTHYDVVHIPVHSEDLHRFRQKIATASGPRAKTTASYNPHITLAYVRKGEGAKYKGMKHSLSGKSIGLKHLNFLDRNVNRKPVNLGGTNAAANAA